MTREGHLCAGVAPAWATHHIGVGDFKRGYSCCHKTASRQGGKFVFPPVRADGAGGKDLPQPLKNWVCACDALPVSVFWPRFASDSSGFRIPLLEWRHGDPSFLPQHIPCVEAVELHHLRPDCRLAHPAANPRSDWEQDDYRRDGAEDEREGDRRDLLRRFPQGAGDDDDGDEYRHHHHNPHQGAAPAAEVVFEDFAGGGG